MKTVQLAVASAAVLCVGTSMAASPLVTLGLDGTVSFGQSGVIGATFDGTGTFSLDADASQPPLKFEQAMTPFNSAVFTEVPLKGMAFDLSKQGALLEAIGLEASGASPQTLVVEGTKDGRGFYSGHASATPIADPENYALTLAGLGVLGFMARRRRS